MTFTIGTYNFAKPTEAGMDVNWATRKGLLDHNISTFAPDILGCQEVSRDKNDRTWLENPTSDYQFLYLPQNATGLGILFNQRRFTLVDQSTGVFSAIDNGRVCTRSYLSADLRDSATGKVIRVVNMHLYGGASRGSPLANQQLASFRSQFEQNDSGIEGIYILADLNNELEEERRRGYAVGRTLVEYSRESPYTYKTAEVDQHARKIITTKSGRHLDHVLAGTKTGSPLLLVPINTDAQDKRASDHFLHIVQSSLNTGHAVAPSYLAPERISRPAIRPAFFNPSIMSEAIEGLKILFARQSRITRDDLLTVFQMDKYAAKGWAHLWSREGLLAINGTGRQTNYTAGTRLNSTFAAPRIEPARSSEFESSRPLRHRNSDHASRVSGSSSDEPPTFAEALIRFFIEIFRIFFPSQS